MSNVKIPYTVYVQTKDLWKLFPSNVQNYNLQKLCTLKICTYTVVSSLDSSVSAECGVRTTASTYLLAHPEIAAVQGGSAAQI